MYIIGTDIGSISIATVAVDLQGNVVASDYRFHRGEREDALRDSIEALGIEEALRTGRTSTSPDMLHEASVVDEKVAYIAAARRQYGEIGSLLVVGAETFSIIHFGDDGSYKRLKTNSSCAAGTGSFLDQQASRLSLKDSAELSQLALENRGEVPKIASRCAVFAKTDLIHAQAEGYGLSEICDGLCLGLARNILDTLVSDEAPPQPLIFAGGVAKNRAVHRHLEQLLQIPVKSDTMAPLLGAWGTALQILEEADMKMLEKAPPLPACGLVKKEEKKRTYFYQPLSLSLSDYPDFSDHRSEILKVGKGGTRSVETDIYISPAAGSNLELWLGIDIGSTSTKAVLSRGDEVYLGLYTRTAGKPLEAVQALFEAIRQMEQELDCTFTILGAGTTGSGRKFIGKVIGADLAVDEITAHARAAWQLDPRIDTIIEIGGQDSKFTTMNNGMVTFSQMNTICAAGTGSFIEEQAQKLGVPLTEYSVRAENQPAPLTSDRCTVFMERDINNYLNQDYSVDEALAAALFSVRENYLQKVASEAHIGSHVCFQGATAKNRALVAAFEQKLQRPLFVSRYCHLTGALGTALILEEECNAGISTSPSISSTFRGLDLYNRDIPVRTEICELCANHCRIRIAEIDGETVAFGFLCGRDYDTRKYIDKNSSGFDLLKQRKQLFADASLSSRLTYAQDAQADGEFRKLPVIAIPAALHMVEQLPFWKRFFAELGFPVVSSEHMQNPIKAGKNLTGAEFCAPMTAFHGHADYAARKGDLLFIPYALEGQKEKHEEKAARKFCYYTQYSPALVKAVSNRRGHVPVLTPLIKPGNFPHNIQELSKVLSPYLGKKSAILDIARAFSAAHQYQEDRKKELKKLFQQQSLTHGLHGRTQKGEDVEVLLLGRPYTVLSKAMNSNIPELFGNLGVKAFFQDMLPDVPAIRESIAGVLSAFHWHYAADILEGASYAASSQGLYPVYITSFKCSPDAFALDYFKKIMDEAGKPYLILQLDEHDSSVGYETRIEAGIRSFRNHRKKELELQPREEKSKSFLNMPVLPSVASIPFIPFPGRKKKGTANPVLERDITGKTLLFPNWDPITSRLVTANLRREGIDARILKEDALSIQKSMGLNTGQCLPVSIVAQETMDYVQNEGLDPAKTVLWIAKAEIACNIPMYPYYLKNRFEEAGGGMEQIGVYVGDISHIEISPKIAIYTYFAYMFGGLLRKLACKIRPYEVEKGKTDILVDASLDALEEAFLEGKNFEITIGKIIRNFESLERRDEKRPKVAIFGDLYVRDNDVMNQDLIHTIEAAGGEVITTPYNEYAKIISQAYFRKWIKRGDYLLWLKNRSLLAAAELIEKKYYSYFQEFFGPGEATRGEKLDEQLRQFNLTLEHDGESMENILKIFRILEDHEEVALFVQTSPSYCCPALVTEAMNRDIERVTGVPVVSITYDGTGTFQNDKVVPYIKFGTGTVTDGSSADKREVKYPVS